jgi:16S rRNA U1498 N3-methylase RsmE
MSDIPVLLREDLTPDLTTLELKGDDFHHIRRVLRLKGGNPLELRDGKGLFAHATLSEVGKHRALLEIGESGRAERPPLPRLHLALPLLKGRKLDWVLEKGTELGVEGFHLFVSRYCVVKRDSAPDRYHELITSAFRQCKRHFLPELTGPVPFDELVTATTERGWRSLWGDENLAELDPLKTPEGDQWLSGKPTSEVGAGGEPLADESSDCNQQVMGEVCAGGERVANETGAGGEQTMLAWVGPEGGFAAEEREALARHGTSIGLGPHRLRSETAALAIACRVLLRDPS